MSFGIQESRDLLALLAKLQSRLVPSTFSTQAWEKFLSIGLPKKKSLNYQFFPLKALYESLMTEAPHAPGFRPLHSPSIKIVFEKGSFCKQRSQLDQLPSGVICLSMDEALKKFRHLIEPRLKAQIEDETDPFALLNMALQAHALFLYIPPHCVIDTPIEFVHEESHLLSFGRVNLIAGKDSHISLVEQTMPWNFFSDFFLEEGAFIEQIDLTSGAWPFSFIRASLKKAAQFRHFRWASGGEASLHDYRITLREEGGSAFLTGLATLDGRSESHVNVLMQHLAPATTSQQTFHAMQEDHSRSVFRGKIYVDAKAQKTNAYQMSRSLLLGAHPIATSEPQLEIFADDVKASHGATVAQLRHDELFYLKTRGLSESSAKRLLVNGFCKELVHQIEHIGLRTALLKHNG